METILIWVLFWAPSHSDFDVENRAQWVAVAETKKACDEAKLRHEKTGFYWCMALDADTDK